MEGPQSNKTVELAVNNQQMSQIDLSPVTDRVQPRAANETPATGQPQTNRINLEGLKRWPSRVCESVGAKMDEASAKSRNKFQYAKELVSAFSGTIIWLLCFVCTIVVPAILFIVGLFNLDDCVDRPSLPYLVFSIGFTMTASNLFNLALSFDLPILTNHRILSSETKNIIASIINIMFNCIVAFLYIICAFMVFNMGKKNHVNNAMTDEYPEPHNETPSDINCNSMVYQFTLWFILLTLGLFGTLGLTAGIIYAYNNYRLALVRGSTPRSQNPATTPTNSFVTSTNRI